MRTGSNRIHLDCCALLNVYATGLIIEVLNAHTSAHGTYFVVADVVMRTEALWVGCGQASDPGSDREIVDLGPLVAAGVLHVEELTTPEEAATFVALASVLDDGEAATASLAVHRGGAVATDDSKAIRVLSEQSPPLVVLRTSELMKGWSDTGVPSARVAEALEAIRERARFEPGPRDPHVGWWNGITAGLP
jgi:hypothetical protein